MTVFEDSGSIGSHGILGSLLRKLEAGQLEAYINEVKAQRGKHIAEEAADYLLRDAFLITGR